MNIKIWDSVNNQWLEPMAIFFGKENTVWKVTACKIGEDPLSDGWYDLHGDDLKKIAITGSFSWNTHLLPSTKQSTILNSDSILIEFTDEGKFIIQNKSTSDYQINFNRDSILLYSCISKRGSHFVLPENIDLVNIPLNIEYFKI